MCWIIPLIVGLLSALLGYLIGKRKGEESTQLITTRLSEENNTLRTQLDDCKNQQDKVLSDEEIKNHHIYQSLKTKYAELKNSDTKGSEQQSTIISELRAENLRIRQALEHCESSLSNAKSDTNGASNIAAFAAETTTGKAFDADAAKSVFGKKIKENDLTVVEGIGPKIAELFNQANITTWYELSKTSVEDCQKILDNAGERFAIHNPSTWPRQAKLAAKGKWQKLFDWQEELDGGKE